MDRVNGQDEQSRLVCPQRGEEGSGGVSREWREDSPRPQECWLPAVGANWGSVGKGPGRGI